MTVFHICTRAAFVCLYPVSLLAQLPPAMQNAVDQSVRKALETSGVPSASIAIVKDGKLAYAHAYGFARLDGNVAATTRMRYKIGSNCKQITATAILLLTRKGKISLDDRVSRFFPDLTRAREITIRELLSHTSGYEDYYALDYVAPYMLLPTTPKSIMDSWAKRPLNFDPGTKWQYSNTNYVIAGAIIEQITGKPLIDFLQSRIFGPLGMHSAIDVDQQPWSATDPIGYTRFALGPLRAAQPEGANWIFAAGELAMTPSDMALWNISLINGTLLNSELLDELTTEVHLKNGAGTHYALGLGISNSNGHRIWSHGGGTSGFISANTTNPDDRIAVTVFTNEDDPAAGDIAHDIAKILTAPATDPKAASTLAVVQRIYGQLRDGTLDRTLLTSDANAYFTSQAIADYSASLKPLGTPRAFRQTSVTERGGMDYRFYAVETPSKTLTVSTFVMPDGKIDQFLVYPSRP